MQDFTVPHPEKTRDILHARRRRKICNIPEFSKDVQLNSTVRTDVCEITARTATSSVEIPR